MASARIAKLWPGRAVLFAVSVPAIALGAAPAARADPTDDAFIAVLKASGILHESNQAAIAAGRFVCQQLEAGVPQDEIATDVMNSSGLDGPHAGHFVAVAERAYCPHFADIPPS